MNADGRRWLWRLGPPLAVGVVAFVAMRGTMLPGVDFWDTGELQTVGPVMGTGHPTGFPTWVLLAWVANLVLTPFGEPALRMNLLSALCVAAAAAVTVDLTRALTRSVALGVMAGLGLALTEIVWSIGTHAETHSLHLLLMAVLFRLLIAWEDAHERGDGGDRWLVAAAVVYGLGIGNHSLTLLLAPAVGLFVLAVEPRIWRRPRLVVGCVAALFGTAALVYLELPIRAGLIRAPLVYGRPETWDGFWYIALAEQFRGSLVAPFSDLAGKFRELVDRTAGGFGPIAALIPIGFVAAVVLRPRYALLSGLSVLATCFFAASYDNADIGRYYLVPALIAWTWIALLASAVVTALSADMDPVWPADDGAQTGDSARAGDLATAAGDLAAPGSNDVAGTSSDGRPRFGLAGAIALLFAIVLLIPTALAVPDRAARVDRGGDTAARRWLDQALATLPPDALVLSWWSYSTPLWYAQHIEGLRPDVLVIDDRTRLDQHLGDLDDVIDANLATRPIYAIRADLAELAALGDRYVVRTVLGVDGRTMLEIISRREGGA